MYILSRGAATCRVEQLHPDRCSTSLELSPGRPAGGAGSSPREPSHRNSFHPPWCCLLLCNCEVPGSRLHCSSSSAALIGPGPGKLWHFTGLIFPCLPTEAANSDADPEGISYIHHLMVSRYSEDTWNKLASSDTITSKDCYCSGHTILSQTEERLDVYFSSIFLLTIFKTCCNKSIT